MGAIGMVVHPNQPESHGRGLNPGGHLKVPHLWPGQIPHS